MKYLVAIREKESGETLQIWSRDTTAERDELRDEIEASMAPNFRRRVQIGTNQVDDEKFATIMEDNGENHE